MPRVPTYNSQVKDASLPNVTLSANAPEEAFGGPAARRITEAARGLANTVFKIADEEKQKADQLAVLDADQKLSAFETFIQYDPQSGAMNKKGKDAFELPDTVKAEWEKKSTEIEKDLKNDSQRMAYKKMVVQRWGSLDQNIQRHVSNEIRQYDDQVTDSYLTNERDAATANYLDQGRINMSIDRQRSEVVKHAMRNGLPEEWMKGKIDEVTSKTHVSVINRMLVNDQDLTAKSYFDEHKPYIAGSDISAVEKVLEEGSLRGESQRQSDKIMATTDTMSEAIESSKKVEDPKLRDAIVDRIKDNYSLRKVADEERRTQLYQGAANIVEQTKDRDKVPPHVWAQLNLSERNAIDARARQLREGVPPVTNWPTYYELKTLASAPATRDKFLRENLLVYRPDMADSEFKELINLQTNMRNGDDKELDGYRTKAEIVNSTLNSIGVDPTPKPGKKEADSVSLFRRQVDEQIVQMQQQTGKKATNADVQGIVDNLVVKGTVQGTGFFGMFQTKRRAFEAKEGENIVIDKEDIPRSERIKITEALGRRGIPVTDDAIIGLYNQKLQRMVQR